MLANLLKSLSVTNKPQLRYTYELTRRQLCSHKQNNVDKDEEDVITNLFDQSSLKFEPVSAEDILRKNKTQKSIRKEHKTSVRTKAKPVNVPTPIKKTHLERAAESVVINDKELGLEFIKLSLNDPQLTTLLTMARSKKRRDKDGQIIVEGRRLILEALTCGLKLNAIIFSQKDQLAEMKEQVAEYLKRCPSKIYKVPHHDLKTWSTLTTPPGVMAVFERPSLNYVVRRLSENSSPPLPVTVVCDNIREPNNLGSIIRTCAALPCHQIVITKGCCDPWDSKALRGGCGGQFRVPLRDDVDWQDVPMTIPPEVADDCCVFVAENNLQKLQNKTMVIDYAEIEKVGSHNVVIIGGESHGVSTEAYRFMANVGSRGKCLYIPLAEGIDSLNVASALTLILYEMRKNILNKQMVPVFEKNPFNDV